MSAMDYPKMLMMISESQLNPESLIERTISLEDAAKELPLLDTALITGITIITP